MLAGASGLAQLSSDPIRKQLGGIPEHVLRARAAQRDRDPARVSDAGRTVVERERTG
jgi:predicted kinase